MCLIPVVFHIGSNYDYHFIIKELANEFEGQREVLGKTQKSTKLFSVPTEKEVTNIDKMVMEMSSLYLTK